jgi:hypothetical protein
MSMEIGDLGFSLNRRGAPLQLEWVAVQEGGI